MMVNGRSFGSRAATEVSSGIVSASLQISWKSAPIAGTVHRMMLGRRTVRQDDRSSAGIVAGDDASCGLRHLTALPHSHSNVRDSTVGTPVTRHNSHDAGGDPGVPPFESVKPKARAPIYHGQRSGGIAYAQTDNFYPAHGMASPRVRSRPRLRSCRPLFMSTVRARRSTAISMASSPSTLDAGSTRASGSGRVPRSPIPRAIATMYSRRCGTFTCR